METSDYRKKIQADILEALKTINFENPDWHKPFTMFDPMTKHNNVIWYLKELVEKGEYIDEIFALSKIYAEDTDPTVNDEYVGNNKLERGDEIRNITSVRGVVCWLLSSLAGTFRTDLYPEIISILEKLAIDPVYYVRTQVAVPLSFFARNINAIQYPNGNVFDFKTEDKQRVLKLSFQMLEQHRDLPRVLQSVVHIFDSLRSINQTQAQQVIEYFFYDSEEKLQPDYLIHEVIPLLIFFAEFKIISDNRFDSVWFQEFAFKVLTLSEKKAPRLRSTFIWHTWKEIQSDPSTYPKFKKYIQFFLTDDYELEDESLGQYEFLVKEVLSVSPDDGVELFKKILSYVLRFAPEYDIQQHAWLLTTHEIVDEIAKSSPKDLVVVLTLITEIVSRNIRIGYLDKIFQSYLLTPEKEEREQMRTEIQKLYDIAKKSKWAEKGLPETI